MEWLVWTVGVMVAVIVILALFIIRIEIDYRRVEEDDALSITVSTLAGLIRIKRQMPVLKLDADEPSIEAAETNPKPLTPGKNQKKRRVTVENILQSQQKKHYWKNRITDLFHIIKYFLSKVRCEQLVWRSAIGTGEASETGTLTGLAWSVKTATVGWGTRYVKMRTVPELEVTPDFHHTRLDTHFRCIVKFRLGEAILTGARILLHAKKHVFKKGLNQAKNTEAV